jgi:hypothetical protein
VRIVQNECGAQLPLRELSARCIKAQHGGHRQLHAGRHLHAALRHDRLGCGSERRTDAGMAIAVGEPADRHLLHGGQRHDAPIVPFEPRGVDRDVDPAKWQLVTAALQIHCGFISGCEGMDNAEAIEIGGQPKPRVVGAGRLQPLLGKQKCEAVDSGGEEVGPLTRLFRIQIDHFRQCDHFVLVAAAIGDDPVQRSDCARRIVVVALRENPAAQDVARRWAELVGGEGIGGELALGRADVDALYADRRLAPGGEQQPVQAAQSEENVRRRAFHGFGVKIDEPMSTMMRVDGGG